MNNTIWLIGRPCAGKTTISEAIKHNAIRLDGDVLRKGLNSDLGFSIEDRSENLRRVAEISKIFNDNGHDVICSFVTPCELQRRLLASINPCINFVNVYCSLEIAIKRDVKGMYKKALRGEIKDFTGIDSVYEEPLQSILKLDTETQTIQVCAAILTNYIKWCKK